MSGKWRVPVWSGERRRVLFFAVVSALWASMPGAAHAAPTVELWGHNECEPCVRLGALLRERKVALRSHNLHLPEVEQQYVRRFGRGDIPVAVVGSTVIRGYKPEALLAAVGRQTAARQHSQGPRVQDEKKTPAPQLCVSGIPLEDFFQQEAKGPFVPGRDRDEILFDRCYGAKGRLLCLDGEVPFEELDESGAEWRVKPTYQAEWITKPRSCTVLRY